MKVWVLASRKGGAGKTTLSAHLAVHAAGLGLRVAVADLDPQGGLASWWNDRADSHPNIPRPLFANAHEGIHVALAAAREGKVDLLLIDTPPGVGPEIGDAVRASSLVIVPVQPSPNDLKAVGRTVDVVLVERKAMVFVINRAGRERLTAQAAIALSQYGAVASPMLGNRIDFRSAMIDGRTAPDLDPQSKASAEISALWDYLSSRDSRAKPPRGKGRH